MKRHCLSFAIAALCIAQLFLTNCSVRQNLNNVCGTYVDDWSGGLLSIALKEDSSFYCRNICDSHLTHYDITCTGNWSIINQKYLSFDCTKGHQDFWDSLSCIEKFRETHYIDINGDSCLDDGRLRITRRYLKNNVIKLKRVKP